MIRQVVMAAIQMDLPEFVAPAMSKCGMLARSETSGWPLTSRPKGTANGELIRVNASDSIIGRRRTTLFTAFGTSMPM